MPDLAEHNYCISLRVTLCVHVCVGLHVYACDYQLMQKIKFFRDIRRTLSCGTFRINKLLLRKVNARMILHVMLHFIVFFKFIVSLD